MVAKKQRAQRHVRSGATRFVGNKTPAARMIGAAPGIEIAVVGESDVRHGAQMLAEAASAGGVGKEMFLHLVAETAELLKAPRNDDVGLSQSDAQYLIDSGDFTEAEFAEAAEFVRSGALAQNERRTHMRALVDALTTAQVAGLLGLEQSSIRHRQSKKALYSFRVGTDRVYPRWQFLAGGNKVIALPNLKPVLTEVPAGWTPADVEGFMKTPQDELRPGDGDDMAAEPMTPIQWLAAGKDAQRVVEILEETVLA